MTLSYHILLDKDYGDPKKKNKLDSITSLVNNQLSDILIAEKPEDADVLLVGGGDGFMIRMIKKYASYGKPFFGINAGTVGFLLNHMNSSNFPKSLDEVDLIPVPIIKTKSITHSGEEKEKEFVNDVLIGESGSGFHNFEFTSKAQGKLINIMCSELLINTPMGSSGQALNGRLPLMDMKSKLLGITTSRGKGFDWGYIRPEEITIKDVRGRDTRHAKHDGKTKENRIDNVKEITIYPPEKFVNIAYKKDEDYHDKRILLAQESLGNVILGVNGGIIN